MVSPPQHLQLKILCKIKCFAVTEWQCFIRHGHVYECHNTCIFLYSKQFFTFSENCIS